MQLEEFQQIILYQKAQEYFQNTDFFLKDNDWNMNEYCFYGKKSKYGHLGIRKNNFTLSEIKRRLEEYKKDIPTDPTLYTHKYLREEAQNFTDVISTFLRKMKINDIIN